MPKEKLSQTPAGKKRYKNSKKHRQKTEQPTVEQLKQELHRVHYSKRFLWKKKWLKPLKQHSNYWRISESDGNSEKYYV